MVGTLALRVLEAWVACAVLQGALWAVAQRTKNAGIVDVGWAQSFTIIILLFGLRSDVPRGGWLPLAVLVIAWSTRLSCYLISRGAATGAEEGRYVDLRRRWARHAPRRFFAFFQAQAGLSAVLSLAFIIPFVIVPTGGAAFRVIGFAIAAIGIAGEAVADAQLAAWKANAANVGKVCDRGLWAWSRHPNYFFEWCVWIGFAVYCFAFPLPYALLGLLGQGIIIASIFGVTGIPPTEAQALRSKGEAYRAYQARVSRFIPRRPKSGAHAG